MILLSSIFNISKPKKDEAEVGMDKHVQYLKMTIIF